MNKALLTLSLMTAATVSTGAMAADIKVANLVDFSGRTATVGKPYGQAKIDAVKWINAHGGVNGKQIDMDSFDYSYEVPRALAQYKKWKQTGVIAIQGWGTGDTEAMVSFIAKDQMPYYSASYSAHLTDPQGKGPNTKKAAPFNFPMGPSYSDGVRALIQWASADFKAKGGKGKPKFVHMGDNHPYPNAPKEAGESYAAEMGFEVVPAINYSLKPGGFKTQCLSLKQSGADYAFLANTASSNISLLKSCATVGVTTQFMANIWGFDENAMKASGTAGDGVVWVMGAAAWTTDAPGIKLVHEIAKAANADTTYQTVHYMRGVCSIYYMKEAMEWADKNGGVNGANIKKGMYQKRDWVPKGLEGVCPAGNWTHSDHRGFTDVMVYRATVKADADVDTSIAQLIADGTIGMEEVYRAQLPRKAEWLGL